MDIENKEFFLEIGSSDGFELQFFSEDLKCDEEIVLAAISSTDGKALEYACEKLKENKNFIIKVASSFGGILEFASNEKQADKEVVRQS